MGTRSKGIAHLCFAFLCAAAPALAVPRWTCVTTSHFEMYTTNNENQAGRALQTFEQIRYFFQQKSRNHQAPEGRVRIIAFSSENEFKPYRMNAGNFAFYLQSRERDYIVMQDLESDHLQAAAHEYTHLILRHSKLYPPLWLDEGLAELYSSLERKGQQSLIGRPLVQHVITLRTQPWMDFNLLFAVDHESPYYNQPDKMQIFYAQSWELTHMIALTPAYSAHFSDFLLAVNGGMKSADAFQKVYGKSVGEVARDARRYMEQATVSAAVFDITLKKSDLDAEVAPLSPLQTNLALCDLLASRPQTADQARHRLLALEEESGQSPEVEESLGYLAWQQNNDTEARRHFSLAVSKGSRSGRMYYDYAGLEHMASGASQAVIDLMIKAVELKPGNDSRILLAQLQLEAHHYGQVLATLAPIHTLEPGQAFNFYSVSAYTRANLKDLPGARSNIQKAASYAKTPEQQHQVDEFMRFLETAEHPAATAEITEEQDLPQTAADSGSSPTLRRHVPGQLVERPVLPRVHGILRTFACGQHSFRLHLLVGTQEMVFAMDDPKDIVVRNVTDLQWTCGPLRPQDVTVVYKPAANSQLAGTVAELVFEAPK